MPEKPREMDRKHGWNYRAKHKRDSTLSLEGKRAWTCPGSEDKSGPTGGPHHVLRAEDMSGTPRMGMIGEDGKMPWGVVG